MNTHAAGQYLGFSLQPTRFLMHLLQQPLDASVSLEVFEDVGVEAPGQSRLAEQTKSSLVGNPVADRARDLWKTFSNWVDAVTSGELEPEKTTFVIYVSGAAEGDIVRDFSDASTIPQARDAITRARGRLSLSDPAFTLESSVSRTIRPYVKNFFDAEESIICTIVRNFHLESASDPQCDLKALLATKFVAAEIQEDVLAHAHGWVKTRTDSCLHASRPAIISVKEFHTEMTAFIRKHDRRTMLASFAGDPDQEEVQRDMTFRVYVRQLDAIQADDEQKIRAVVDFLRASTDRTQWSAKGLVHESSFDEFESGLIRTWDNCRRRADIALQEHSEIERGQYLYSECSSHRALLEGLEVPDHFTPGSFHLLADTLVLGWHPNYRVLLAIAAGNEGG